MITFTCSCSSSLTRIKKSVYPRVYKVRLQQPNGSTFTIRYHEPRELIRLPVDPDTLTEEEKLARLNRLKPEKKLKSMNLIMKKRRSFKDLGKILLVRDELRLDELYVSF